MQNLHTWRDTPFGEFVGNDMRSLGLAILTQDAVVIAPSTSLPRPALVGSADIDPLKKAISERQGL